MFTPTLSAARIAAVLAAACLIVACNGNSVVEPSPPAPSAAAEPPQIAAISPPRGTSAGGTLVQITGSGLLPPVRVTLGGQQLTITAMTNTSISARTPPHAAGVVDLVVTTQNGQTATVSGGYTYEPAFPPSVSTSPPSVTSVSPNTVATGGGLGVRVSGMGFQPGSRVTIDGVAPGTHFLSETTLIVSGMSHEAGAVDILVTNPDGQTALLPGGLTYVPSGTFDANGIWKGSADHRENDHWSEPMEVTIIGNRVVSASCGSTPIVLPEGVRVENGEFSVVDGNRLILSGRMLSADLISGRVDVHPCGASWGAQRR